ncbi:MAG: hypothetical protein ABR975_08795 [Vulcanimicrobiaceae bacterium]|jgi:hypothetical protein
MLPFVLATVLAAAPVECAERLDARRILARSKIASVGRVDGDEVVVAQLREGSPCFGSVTNGEFYVIRLRKGHPSVLADVIAVSVTSVDANPLPVLVFSSHISSTETNEMSFSWQGRSYREVSRRFLRNVLAY